MMFVLVLNVAFARDRFTDAERKKFLDEVRQEIAQHKTENQGKVDLQIIKPAFYAELETLIKQEKINRNEATTIKQRFETLSKDKTITNRSEEVFFQFLDNELAATNAKPLEKINEGNVCNTWSCADGLKCAPDPIQNSTGKLKKAGEVCNDAAECASGECYEEKTGSKKKVCEEVYRCFRPLNANESCNLNPVCSVGSCLPFNSMTSGIGECEVRGNVCKKNSDCCSNSCQQGICKDNFTCKDCVQNGSKPQRGQKCCEGLYLNDKGRCIPDMPPFVMPQVRTTPLMKILVTVVDFIFSSAEAATKTEEIGASFDKALKILEDKPVGSTVMWNTVRITNLGNDKIRVQTNGGDAIEVGEKANLIKIAQQNYSLRYEFIKSYGIDPLSTKQQNLDNKAALDRVLNDTSDQNMAASLKGFLSHVAVNKTTGVVTVTPGNTYSSVSAFMQSPFYAAATGANLTDADYADMKDEAASVLNSNSLDDDEIYLNAGAKDNGKGLVETIKEDRDKYANFVPKSAKADDLETGERDKLASNIKINLKSNFDKCEFDFKNEYFKKLKSVANPNSKIAKSNDVKPSLFDMELAFLAFDFVTTGDSDPDYWVKSRGTDSSIISRLKKIGLAHRAQRQVLNKQFEEYNKELTCACIDVHSPEKLNIAEKTKFFYDNCSEATKYKDPTTPKDQVSGDASGIKAKDLIVKWTENIYEMQKALVVSNANFSTQIREVDLWAKENSWSETRTKNYDLFKFNIKNPSSSSMGLGAIVGALLAAGVIAILGGFATTSLLSAWGAAGIIAASAVTGASGLWMIASLKGAWITSRPQISDNSVQPRSYSCGKKESCLEYTRTLIQPYNEVCDMHTSANACIKSFVVIKEGNNSRYIVDPWIPVGVPKANILKGQPKYVERLERGFQSAKAAMVNKNPGANGGGGKKGGGEFVSESYLSEVFIDAEIVGQYLPSLNDLVNTHYMSPDKVLLIKNAAKKFAVDEGMFEASETANLNIFADYAYEYHFLWPKKSREDEISYPTVGLSTYLSFMADEIAATAATNANDGVPAAKDLHKQYLDNLRDTMKDFIDLPINQLDPLVKKDLEGRIAEIDQKLTNLKAIDTILNNANLDVQLSSLGNNPSADQLKSMGLSGGVKFDKGQLAYLGAIGSLRSDRKKQLKALESYNRAMASSGNKDRAAKMAATSKKFSDRFAKGSSFNGRANAISGGSGNASGLGATSATATDANKTSGTDGTNGAYFTGSGAGVGGASGVGAGSLFGGGSRSGSGSGSSSSSSGEGSAGENSETAGAAGADTGIATEDQKRLADAIAARNRAGLNKYETSEDQTIFEQITNAYIRNYDKVLSKKKDKDVIEEKQQR